MPDFKLRKKKIYFSILNPTGGKHPLLLPRIDNPDFLDDKANIIAPPGIKQLVEGDLGIAEKIMMPILDPILSQVAVSPILAEMVANTAILEEGGTEILTGEAAVSKAKLVFLDKYIPKDFGIKAIEKTVITSMFESYKPLVDFIKLLLEMLGIAEDVVCRFFGTSIGKIGIPSRNPKYWSEELDYAKTINAALQEMTQTADDAVNESEKNMSDDHLLKKNVPSADSPSSPPSGNVDLPAVYVGYFDEDGNDIDPPGWIKNSGKWFRREAKDINGVLKKFGSPFEQLSTDVNSGFDEIRERYTNNLAKLQRNKVKMIEEIDKRAKDIQPKKLSPELLKVELESINVEKTKTIELFDSLIFLIEDILDGTNKTGNNFVEDNPSKGVNSSAILHEWQGKNSAAQLRKKYFPERISTVQEILDKNKKPLEPYVFIPAVNIKYKGKNVKVEVPLAYQAQIKDKRVTSRNRFFDTIKGSGRKKYSFQNEIVNLDMFYGTDRNTPYNEQSITYFGHEDANAYLADKVKNYYLNIEWEEILEYEIRSKKTGKVLRTEREVTPFNMDIENDYELRVIQVINIPLLAPPSQTNGDEHFPAKKDDILLTYDDSFKILEIKKTKFNESVVITDSSGNDSSTIRFRGTKYFKIGRYIDESIYIPNDYFLLRKTNARFGTEDSDSDDGEIFRINRLEEIWNHEIFVIEQLDSLVIDNSKKTITAPHFFFSNLPKHILEYNKNQFYFSTGTKSNNRRVRITRIRNYRGKIILTYSGSLTSETIQSTRCVAATEKFNKGQITDLVRNDECAIEHFPISYNYMDKLIGVSDQTFDSNIKFSGDFYFIKDINYIPKDLKSLPASIFIQGFNNKSLLSSINKTNTRSNISQLINNVPDMEEDGLYNIRSTKNIRTDKNLGFKALKISENIPSRFRNKVYSANPSSKFYYPLKILSVPNQQSIGNNTVLSSQLGKDGTLFSDKNNIPDNYNPDKPNNPHSTPDIKENNNLKEGIIFQGLDPRYVDRTKYKYFWLVEAIKKDDDGIARLNGKITPSDQAFIDQNNTTGLDLSKGKEWYELTDKFTAIPMIILKMLPIIINKMIPLLIKIITLVSNPTKIKEFLLDVGLRDENISKFPQNFKAFSSTGTLGKIADLEKEGVSSSFDDAELNPIPKDPFVYNGPQVGVDNPSVKSMLDGQALVEFGNGAFGKAIATLGLQLSGATLEVITEKTPQTDFTLPPIVPDQPIFTFILGLIKMPFEIIFMIFSWLIEWIKRMLNPVKIPKAMADLLSFKWLLDILGKDSIFKILGIPDLDSNPLLQAGIDEIRGDISGDNAQFLLDKTKEALRGRDFRFIEVLVYNILVNGNVVGTERVEKPYSGSIPNSNLSNDFNDPNDPAFNADKNFGSNVDPNNPGGIGGLGGLDGNIDDPLRFCGPRNFNLKEILPIPFWTDMPSYTACELPIIYLKPLETAAGFLQFLQNMINGCISMPSAILGLEPIIPIPKFGEEIPMADVLYKIIDQIKASLPQLPHNP